MWSGSLVSLRNQTYHHSLQMWGLCTRYISQFEKRSSPAHSVRVNQLTIKLTGITLLSVSTLTVYRYFISPLPPRSGLQVFFVISFGSDVAHLVVLTGGHSLCKP